MLDLDENFCESCNAEMVDLVKITDAVELAELKELIIKHHDYTNSSLAQKILDDFDHYAKQFTKVLPRDYKRMLDAMERVKALGLTGDEALMAAFEENNRDLSRVSGN